MPGFLIATVVVTLLALLVLRALGALRDRRALAAFVTTACLAQLGWLSVTSFQATESALDLAARVAAMAWTIACICVIVFGVPPLAVRGARALVARLRRAPPKPPRGVDLARRRVLSGLVPVAALATSARGSVGGLSRFVVKREEVRVAGLPPALDGFTIGQITDVHVGPFISVADLVEAVRALDGEGVQLLTMTGDLLDDIDELDACLDALAATRATHGCLAVLGNHEMWRGHERVLEAYAARAPEGRLRLLVDESVALAGVPLRVVGVDWPSRQRRRGRLAVDERRRRMADSARLGFADVRAGEAVLCLTHHPDFFPHAAAAGAHLTLAGHTHGGQVAFFGAPLFSFAFEHMLGRYARPRGDQGEAHLYVGGGTGHWLPWRFGVPPEVTVLTLRAA